MRGIKDFDEREKLLYYKYRSQLLVVTVIEVIVAVFASSMLNLDDVQIRFGVLFLLLISIIFWRVKFLSISGGDKGDVTSSFFAALIWTVFFSMRSANDPLMLMFIIPGWVLAFYTYYLWRKEEKSKRED
jgi:hypothetical protein